MLSKSKNEHTREAPLARSGAWGGGAYKFLWSCTFVDHHSTICLLHLSVIVVDPLGKKVRPA